MSSATQGSAPENNKVALKHKRKCCSRNTQTLNLSLTFPHPSTFSEKDLQPFWTKRSKELSLLLWPVQEIELHARASSLSKLSLSVQEVGSSSWITRVKIPTNLIQRSSSLFSQATVTRGTASEAQQEEKVICSKKVRIFPNNTKAYFAMTALARRAYNLAVGMIKEGNHKVDGKYIDIRPAIKASVEKEQRDNNQPYNSNVVAEAVSEAFKALKSVIEKNLKLKAQGAKEGFAELHFRKAKSTVKSFSLDRLPKSLCPCSRQLGKAFITECLPKEAIGKRCTVTLKNGRWHLSVKQEIAIKIPDEIQVGVSVIALDPGVRTFQTGYSEKDALIAGKDFAQHKLYPLMREVDHAISERQKVYNSQAGKKFQDMDNWAQDRIRFYFKKIDRLKARKDNLIQSLHNEVAKELVDNYDVIYLPKFETRQMVKRKRGSGVRTIRRNTARSMLSLCHYQFQQKLIWMAKKHGKEVVVCSEAYTSKTCSWSGEIVSNLGSSKVISDGKLRACRDLNAAKSILIKNLQGNLSLSHAS